MTLTLGGPGVACSTMTLRRLAAGELSGEARARAEAHLAGCARCQASARGLEAERHALAAELPFEAFAAGVAERLAVAGAPARPPAPPWRRVLPLALAASLAAVVGLPLLSRLAPIDGRDDGARIKGSASATLHVRDGQGSRALAPGEPVPAGAPLRLAIGPAGHRYAAAVLLDEDGPALLAGGPAPPGLLGGAFEWTGRRGQVVVVLDDAPVDGAALLARLRAGGAAAASPGGAAEVVVLPLSRGGP
jgi:hypothetical protein